MKKSRFSVRSDTMVQMRSFNRPNPPSHPQAFAGRREGGGLQAVRRVPDLSLSRGPSLIGGQWFEKSNDWDLRLGKNHGVYVNVVFWFFKIYKICYSYILLSDVGCKSHAWLGLLQYFLEIWLYIAFVVKDISSIGCSYESTNLGGPLLKSVSVLQLRLQSVTWFRAQKKLRRLG